MDIFSHTGMAPDTTLADNVKMPVGPNTDAARQEELEVTRWLERINAAILFDQDRYRAFAAWRSYLAGEGDRVELPGSGRDPGSGDRKRVNVILSTFFSALPHTYPSNPDVDVSPAPAVDDVHYELARGFAETASVVLKRYLVEETNLKRKMKGLERAMLPAGIGWLKMGFYRDYRREPYFNDRRPDAQNELARLSALVQELAEQPLSDRQQELIREIRELEAVLYSQVEVQIRQGLAVDRVEPDDIVISPQVRDIMEGYREAPWIAQGIWYTPDKAAELFDLTDEERKNLSRYSVRTVARGASRDMMIPDADMSLTPNAYSNDETGFVRGWEIWDQKTHYVRTALQGLKRWARDPWVPERQPERWYPFFACAHTRVEGRRYPLSDVALLEQIEQDINEIRRKYMRFRDSQSPKTAFDAGSLSPDSVKEYQNAEIGSTVPMQADLPEGQNMRDKFFTPETPRATHEVFETQSLYAEVERQFGLGEAQTGSVSKAKTATEARQIENAVLGRMSERREDLRELEEEMANAALEILLQELSEEDVRRIAGSTAVWPELQLHEIQDLVGIVVSHQSPEAEQRRQLQWMETLPQMLELSMQAGQLRAEGLEILAEPLIEFMKETFARLDERIAVERFIPGGPVGPGADVPTELQWEAVRTVAPIGTRVLASLRPPVAAMLGPPPGPGPGAPQPTAGTGPAPDVLPAEGAV